MQLEIGSIVEGKVTGITKFGAFVELEGGTVGMVHISEVSSNYVNDISEHLKAQQVVKVKVLSVGDDGKVSLSIKKAMPQATAQPPRRDNKPNFSKPNFNNANGNSNNNNRNSAPNNNNRNVRTPSQYQQSAAPKPSSNSFDDMLSKFLQASDEKNSDVKREKSSRRGMPKRSRDYD